MQKPEVKHQITSGSWLRLETKMMWLKSRGRTELKEQKLYDGPHFTGVSFWVLDLQTDLGFSSAFIYSDSNKPQEHYINLLLAKSLSQLLLSPCMYICDFCHRDWRLLWAVCLKVLFWRLQRKVQNALTYWDWSVLQSTNFIYAFCAPHSTQLEGSFPSTAFSVE